VLDWVEPTLPEKETARASLFEGVSLGVGAVGLHGTDGLGLAVGPTIRGSLGLSRAVFARVTLAGPLVGPRVAAPGGSATVRQQFASVDIGWATSMRPIGAFAWLGAGAFLLDTTGTAIPPFQSTSDSVLSFMMGGGLGGVARIGRRLGFTAEVLVEGLAPKPVVVIAHHDAGTAGAPSFGLSLGLVVAL
jgi:hypothetical protein